MFQSKVLILFYCFATISILADTTIATDNSFCVIREPILKLFDYNFTSLVDPARDLVLDHDSPVANATVRMQLCRPLKQKCNGKDGYVVCLIQNGEEKGIGKMDPTINLKDGNILYMFTGDNCMPGVEYKVTISMKCDYKAGINSNPTLYLHARSGCFLFLVWTTSLACGPRIVKDCTVTNNGLHYDLSPLTRYSQNYVVHTGTKTFSNIILNVCHSVIFGPSAFCLQPSGACLQNSSTSKYINMGDVVSSPVFEDGELKLKYENGGICQKEDVTKPDIGTTITFICDYDAVDTLPEYIKGHEECHYQLIWKTAAACSVESLHNHSVVTAGKCTVTNPLTNFTYDLRPLMKSDRYIVAQNGTQYSFGVCKPLTDHTCIPETGVCRMKKGMSMGKANTNLMWQEGGPYLNYTDGGLCENGNHYSTIIAFVCAPEGWPSGPLVMEQNPCQLIIHWSDDLFCEKMVKCATINDEINLSPLIKSTSNYVVKVNGTEFHINICKPLVPKPGLTCAHGSAVCKAQLNSNKEYVNEISLGFPKEDPVLESNHRTVLRYTGGSICPEDPNKLLSSNFTFPCQYDDNNGSPEFKEYKDCTYVFEWKTILTCGAVMGNWTSPCIIRDQVTSHEYDLSLLYKNRQIYRVNRTGKEYLINICGGSKFCNGSAICQGDNGYGSLANVIFDYSRNVTLLQYSNGGKCVNSSHTSEVKFVCNEWAGIGEPKLLWHAECSAIFEWQTNVTCGYKSSSHQTSVSPDTHNVVQEDSYNHTGMVAAVALCAITMIATLLYFRNPDKRACLRSCWKQSSSRRGNGSVQYCRVDVSEEASILLDVDPTHCQTDSDDDLLDA